MWGDLDHTNKMAWRLPLHGDLDHTNKMAWRLPLHGIRVVDCGTFIAGPLVGRLLGDAGAEVTRVVAAGSEDSEAYADRGEVFSRGKRTCCINLKTADGVAAMWALLEEADVLIENFRPSVMERLGFGRKAVSTRLPRLVYISLPGYASDDPERRDLRAFDGTIMAGCGVFSDMGLNRTLMGVNPSYSTLAMASTYSAVLAALGAVLALLARESSGRGEGVEVPLAAGLCEALVYNSMEVQNLPQRYLGLRNREIDRRRKLGLPSKQHLQQQRWNQTPRQASHASRQTSHIPVAAVSFAALAPSLFTPHPSGRTTSHTSQWTCRISKSKSCSIPSSTLTPAAMEGHSTWSRSRTRSIRSAA